MNTRKYIPLFLIVALSLGALTVYATFFNPWSFTNNLTPVVAPSPTYEGEPKTFQINTVGGDNIGLVSVTLTGQGGTSSIINALCRIEVMNPDWRLQKGYTFLLTVKRPDGSILQEITKTGDADCVAIGKGESSQFVQWNCEFTTNTMTGLYSIFPRITNMTWDKP